MPHEAMQEAMQQQRQSRGVDQIVSFVNLV